MILYILQSTFALLLLFVLYKALLQYNKSFLFNRFYLLSSIILSFVIPLFSWSIIPPAVINQVPMIGTYIAEPMNGFATEAFAIKQATNSWSTIQMIAILYGSITFFFLFRFLRSFYRILNQGQRTDIHIHGMTIYEFKTPCKPHSFLNRLYIHNDDMEGVLQNNAVIFHEKAHVQQLHSLDLLIVELVKSIFWFHPLLWAYKSEIVINHEYLADDFADKQQEVSLYAQNMLLSASKIKNPLSLASGFSYVQLKKRLIMLQQPIKKTSSISLKISSALLFGLAVLAMSAFKMQELVKIEPATSQTEVKPTILPIAEKDLEKIASGYGQRIHPQTKTQKMHTGVDFLASSGTSIVSTAQGIVVLADEDRGYGKHIIIAHGEAYQTHYAHLETIVVEVGDKVSLGQKIGLIGNTGLSNGIHLHYEVIKNGEKVDPANYFK